MKGRLSLGALLLGLAGVLLGPLAARPHGARPPGARALVVITPNNEAVRYELGRAFTADYERRTGERITMDWRTPGGSSEIVRYLDSEYLASFGVYWTKTLGRPWSAEVESAFANPKTEPKGAGPAAEARRAFLESSVSCGIDVLFGGGTYDHKKAAAAGNVVDSGILKTETFKKARIPATFGGETYWDAGGRWVGTCLAAFGISSNRDALRRLGIEQAPQQWSDLADPRLYGQVALANPTQSGSLNTAFELMVQQQMRVRFAATPADEAGAVAAGWDDAMRMIERIGGNARYFTDAAGKVPLDVAAGEAAAGLTIDFYGRFQSEALKQPDGTSRMQYVNAVGGTTFSADGLSMLRGAPHPDLARAFIEWTLTEPAQKLWNTRVGAPGGPVRFALRRLPILPAMYGQAEASDPEVRPYETDFESHGKWTGPLFGSIAFVVRVMCIDSHDELKEAWSALIAHRFPPQATARFADVSSVNYAAANGRIRETLAGDKIGQVQLAKELAGGFRERYREVAQLAEEGK